MKLENKIACLAFLTSLLPTASSTSTGILSSLFIEMLSVSLLGQLRWQKNFSFLRFIQLRISQPRLCVMLLRHLEGLEVTKVAGHGAMVMFLECGGAPLYVCEGYPNFGWGECPYAEWGGCPHPAWGALTVREFCSRSRFSK